MISIRRRNTEEGVRTMGWTVEGVLRRTQRSKALTYVVPAVQPRMVDAMFQFLRWTCRLYDRVV